MEKHELLALMAMIDLGVDFAARNYNEDTWEDYLAAAAVRLEKARHFVEDNNV